MDTIRFTNRNSSRRNAAVQRRIKSISDGTRVNHYALSEVSSGLAAESAGELSSFIDKQIAPPSLFNVTSVEDLRNWANANGQPKLGHAVAFNVPVVCTGFLAREGATLEQATKVLGRDVAGNTLKHERVSAHGLTFGTTFAKAFRGTDNQGNRFVKEIVSATLCNNCLDLWIGKVGDDGRRRANNWVFPAQAPNNRGNRKERTNKDNRQRTGKGHSGKSSKGKAKVKAPRQQSGKTGLPFILKSVQSQISPSGRERDPWRQVTRTMLTSYLKDVGRYPDGNPLKPELIDRLNEYLKVNEPEVHSKINKIIG